MNRSPDSSSLDDAVRWLQSQGLHAFRRNWSLGESIGVAASVTNQGGITVLNGLVFVYLDANRWSVIDLDNVGAPSRHFESMAQALMAVRDRTKDRTRDRTNEKPQERTSHP